MLALRTYQITADDLFRLHKFAVAFFATWAKCSRCGDDLCEGCQKDADLLQLLADAVSMKGAGLDIVFTTQQDSAEKPSGEETIH